MSHKNNIISLLLAGLVLVTASALWLGTAPPANAQCGSQASSCKNCHEVQGQKPVNNDGTAWHTSHAFGDFCYICHGGNQQATNETAAHAGMVPPLSDIKASCQSCHPNDLDARAQVYATKLGVQIGSGTTTAAPATSGSQPTPAAPAEEAVTPSTSTGETAPPMAANLPSSPAMSIDDPNVVNYVQRYNEIVLGQKPVNWGNIILAVISGFVLIGGGVFVLHNEKLINISFGETKKVEGEYPVDVVEILPKISQLKPPARKTLGKVLENPKKAEKVLDLLDEVIKPEKKEDSQ
jgi:hypothetical protein